jgi:hypothetical protein
MRKNNNSIFYYLINFKQEKKIFFIAFLIFISFSAIHYNFKNKSYKLEITYNLDKSKILDFFTIENSFYTSNFYYQKIFKDMIELELNKNQYLIYDYFNNLTKKSISNFNKSSRNLSFDYLNGYMITKKYIIEIQDINNINVLEEILNNERDLFQKKILKNILNSLNRIFLDINKIQGSELENLKIELQKRNFLLEYGNKNNVDTNMSLIQEIFVINKKIENIETALKAEKKNSYYYINNLNYNFVDYTTAYTEKTMSQLTLLLYIFLSFAASIIIILIRLNYSNYK